MADALILGLPSKGRMHEDALKWLGEAGLSLARGLGARGYSATLKGLAGVEIRLLSAGEIASSLESGTLHLGVTGLDLLHERAGALGTDLSVIMKLGFSRARVVVAIPDQWIDVDTMEDLRDVAARYHERTRARLRVATKFRHITRRFFAAHGLLDYRIVPSLGATEGAPGIGAADLVVDITETGSTLKANQLRIVDDGVILQSEAVIAGSLATPWSKGEIEALRALMARLAPSKDQTAPDSDALGIEHFVQKAKARSGA